MSDQRGDGKISLETLVESGELSLPVLHPGGLESTRELAEMCHAGPGKQLLDVASGTGESACFLAETLGCRVTGVDHSETMVATATEKARQRGLRVEFRKGDAQELPFEEGVFDLVISECTTCALDKQKAIAEMARVAKPGGWVGITDLYWKGSAPERLKSKLAELENERPETLAGWVQLFRQAGLEAAESRDQAATIATMSRDLRKQMGVVGQLKLGVRIVRRWGLAPLGRMLTAERIFHSRQLGYAIVVGRKPESSN